ncbi:hypothetical protein [Sanguibacter keddieii]|nr:hypothetical protein [Sanguibacter keddieii]
MSTILIQTSVRLSPEAVTALQEVSARRSLSREAAIRSLLDEFVVAQSKRGEDERLTHMSTVVRFPPPPSRIEQDNRVRVAFRAEPDVMRRAASLALRLPGQPARRGPGHYSPRPLTDALAVAIASAHPYTDNGLETLPTMITHGAALSLWRLTVAATLSNAEARALRTNADSEVKTILNEEDVAWHSPWRFEVLLHIARKLLGGPQRTDNLRELDQPQRVFALWRHDLLGAEWSDSWLMEDCAARSDMDYQGQGGAAVWRAERAVTMSTIERWVVGLALSAPLTTKQPGWSLQMPPSWRAVPIAHGQPLTAHQKDDLDAQRVLRVTAGSRSAIWPYDQKHVPIERFSLVVDAASTLTAPDVVELTLLDEHMGDLWVPADLAVSWGQLTTEESDLLTAAAESNRHRVLQRGPKLHWRERDKLYTDLLRFVDLPSKFASLASQQNVGGGPFQAGRAWTVGSIAALLESAATDEQVRWAVGAVDRRRNWRLAMSMREASRSAYWLGRSDSGAIV